MRTIPLTQGKIALVDDENYESLNQYKWCAAKDGNTHYAVRYSRISNSKQRLIRMHRVILNVPNGLQVDHINGDGLDNRRVNLRLCSRTENDRHQRLSRKNTSGFKGVTKRNRNKPYAAYIQINNKKIQIGYYQTADEAALAYDTAATKYFGEFALTNKMLGLR